MSYPIFSPFVLGGSLIHHLDPRLKVLIALLFSLDVLISWKPFTLLLGLVYSLILILLAHLSLLTIFRRLFTLNLFTGFLFLFLLAPESQMSSQYIILLTLKSNIILLLLTSLVSTIETMTLTHTLYHLGFPHKFVHLFSLTIRYLEILHGEYQKLLQAMKVRGFRPQFNGHTYRSFAYLIGTLLVKSLDRSDRILAAMKCRGFQGKFFLLNKHSLHWRDGLFSSVSLIFLLGMGVTEWFHLW